MLNGGRGRDLLARYLRGEHDEVWRALRARGDLEGDAAEEALAVARETMRRVAHDVDVVAARLQRAGWRPIFGALRVPPKPSDAGVMADVEQTVGAPLPAALRAFWETVGGVDFVWDYEGSGAPPDFGLDVALAKMDPLFVGPPAHAEDQVEEWREEIADAGDRARALPVLLELSPDDLHKIDESGGPPYGVALPSYAADPLFENERHGLPFTDYLRLCFRCGGFPGLAAHMGSARVRAFVEETTRDLLPF